MNILTPVKNIRNLFRGPAEHEISYRRDRAHFEKQALIVRSLHRVQNQDQISYLNKKYSKPLLGEVRVWSLIEMLSRVIDPCDTSLGGISQWGHCLQVYGAMKKDGIQDQEMLLLAIIHDVGKLLMLFGESPENVSGMNEVISAPGVGCGWDECLFNWNHDEFGFLKFRDYLPDPWLRIFRYHSVRVKQASIYMSEADRKWAAEYLVPFRKYDQGSKSFHWLPQEGLDEMRQIVEAYFPKPIIF